MLQHDVSIGAAACGAVARTAFRGQRPPGGRAADQLRRQVGAGLAQGLRGEPLASGVEQRPRGPMAARLSTICPPASKTGAARALMPAGAESNRAGQARAAALS
jgi:hypothetical protein